MRDSNRKKWMKRSTDMETMIEHLIFKNIPMNISLNQVDIYEKYCGRIPTKGKERHKGVNYA
jgi:hypothetical protein